MKKKILLFSFVVVATAATAFKIVNDIIERLGMMQSSAQGNIVSNLVGNFSSGPMNAYDEDGSDPTSTFRLPYVPKLSTVISGDKATAAKELCEYVKAFINSEVFITQYNAQRQSAMPLTDNGNSLSTLLGNKIVFEKNINNYKTDTKYVAEQQKLMDENQKRIDALIEESKKPFEGKANWEKKYPADPSVVVKKRLEEYLQLVATVDFNAALTEPDKYKVKKFTNPAYEKKSLKWKAIYRAGKEVNDVVIAFVKDWMKGEIIAKQKNKMTEKASTETNISQNKTTPVNNPDAPTNTNQNNTPIVNTPAPSSTDSTATPDKKKKFLFNKIKDKASSVIKN